MTVPEYDDVYVALRPRLLRTAYAIAGDLGVAEDAVQTAFAKAYRSWRRISGLESPEAYLRRMVVNEFLSWRRRLTSQEVPVAELLDTAGDDDSSVRQAQRDAMWRLLARLPKQQRAVLVLRYYEDLPDPEIAAVLGCSASTVRSNAARALANLRSGTPGLDQEALP
jgi:RNA polymerase sigma-70 factor (sigma-E family)